VLDVDGLGPVLFCHASTRNDTEIVLVDSPVQRYQACFPDLAEESVVLGHTHMPFDRLVDRRRYVNPGSVGMPYGRAGAHWALLADGAVTLRRTVYDAEAACAAIRDQSGYPDVAEWADYFVHAKASDADALGAFGPRDGRAP
jgi:diadenosine tetraphosphatase ApaH/serine/threonine PP2A family protein phosphatase